jgi:hypothetical protein
MSKAFPWREALLINGLFSAALGVTAFILVRWYASDVHAWLREQSADKAQAVGELVVLCYLAYGVGMVVVALAGFLLPGWVARSRVSDQPSESVPRE